jgi:transcriptional regulator with XRE-family HTH domain
MSTQAIEKTGDILRADVFLLGALSVAKANNETIGQRISRFRKEKGLTQKELAEALAVSQPVVSDYEKDVIRIPADMVVEITKILNVSGDEILGLTAATKQSGTIKNRRLSRRLQDIDKLPKRDQDALFRTIDAFISKS